MKPCMGTGVYTSVIWRIRLNDSCAAAMRQLTLITCLSCQYFLFFLATTAQSLLSCAGHGVSAGRIILITVPRIGQRSIVMTVSVSVCLSVRDHIFGTTRPIFTNFLCMDRSVDWSCSGGVLILYVLPVLWMTSYLLISQGCSTSPPA